MPNFSTNNIRKIWIDFFKEKNHYFVESKSLIPNNDPSLLWINSGIATLKRYFSGELTPPSKRLVNSQKAIRTNDIENVGVTSRHHTFFEMLGNFSIGDYFKKEAISMAYELLTKRFNIDPSKLYITVFKDDHETFQYWIETEIKKDHIFLCDKDRNFWDIGEGPCGPCTEIFYDRGSKYDPKNQGINLIKNDVENDRYIEIWNIVFSQFNNDGKNNYTELLRKNIDTGAGLERLACVLQNVPTNYDTDIFQYIISKISTEKDKYDPNAYFTDIDRQKEINRLYSVIVDHMRTCVFALADGCNFSSKERGYVIRKLFRRAMACSTRLNIQHTFIRNSVNAIVESMSEFYPYLIQNKEIIINLLNQEAKLFEKTLNNGFKLFNENLKNNTINAKNIFKLVDTYGFPYEFLYDLIKQYKLKIDFEELDKLFKKHQDISRSNKQVSGFKSQNPNLLSFTDHSEFVEDQPILKGSKIIAIFENNFDRTIKSSERELYLVFDKTNFYALSGGQSSDFGVVKINDKKFKILKVIKSPNGQHLHLVENYKNFLFDLNNKCEIVLEIDQQHRTLTTINHTSEHLLHQALCEVVDKNIKQEGASKTEKKLTFDFSLPYKLDEKQLLNVEKKVNEYIQSGTNREIIFTSLDEAKKIGAKAYFDEIYSKIKGKLRMIKYGDISCELCGGTHVKNLKDIQQFMIIKFMTIKQNVYRIEAISSNKLVNEFLKEQVNLIADKISTIKNKIQTLNLPEVQQIQKIIKTLSFDQTILNYRNLLKELSTIENLYNVAFQKYNSEQSKLNIEKIKNNLISNIKNNVSINCFTNQNNKDLSLTINDLINQKNDLLVICFNLNTETNKTQYYVGYGKKYHNNNYPNASSIINMLNKKYNGSGGGRDNFAQGGCLKKISKQDLSDLSFQ